MAIGGIATAVGAMLLLGGGTPRRRLVVHTTGVVATSLVAAFAVMAIVGFGFGSLAGAYVGSSLVLALGVAAIGFALTGLQMLAGRVGLVLGILGVVVFGLSLSAIGSAPELLPAGWGTVGQLFPHGATATALRSVAYFDGNGAAGSLVALGSWVVGGAVLMVLAGRARGRS